MIQELKFVTMVKRNLLTIVITLQILVVLTFSQPIQKVISKIYFKTEKQLFKVDHAFLDFTSTWFSKLDDDLSPQS